MAPGEAAGRRLPRSVFSPRPRVRLTARHDGGYDVDLLCATCNHYHWALGTIADAGPCHRSDFRPAGGATFVSSDHYDADDATDIAAINDRAPKPSGPSRPDSYWRGANDRTTGTIPAGLLGPRDLGI